MLKLEAFGITHAGCKRTANEDALVCKVNPDSRQALGIVADGMGGYEGGEVASHLAIEVFTAALSSVMRRRRAQPRAINEAFRYAVDETNNRIRKERESRPELARMGTTLVCAHVRSGARRGFACIAHIGDSRCYRLSRGRLEAKTRDDTVVQAMLDAGDITEADVPRVPFRNVLTRALGVEPEVTATYNEIPVVAGDILMLCSDGVTDALPPSQWPALMAASGTLESQARALIDACLENQADDNVSLALIRIS